MGAGFVDCVLGLYVYGTPSGLRRFNIKTSITSPCCACTVGVWMCLCASLSSYYDMADRHVGTVNS